MKQAASPFPRKASSKRRLKAVKDVYGEELSQAKKPEDKSALAEKLFDQGARDSRRAGRRLRDA